MRFTGLYTHYRFPSHTKVTAHELTTITVTYKIPIIIIIYGHYARVYRAKSYGVIL